ncbi:hypothetical protein PSPO01_15824 [Paraphaeosphaeria sporulosa]
MRNRRLVVVDLNAQEKLDVVNVREGGRCDVEEAAAQRFVGGKALCVSLYALFKASDADTLSHLHSNWNAVALSAAGGASANDERRFPLGTAQPKFLRTNLEVGNQYASVHRAPNTRRPLIGEVPRFVRFGFVVALNYLEESVMESEVNSASPTRRSGRARTKTPKAAEFSSASAQGESNEIEPDYVTEIETDAPGAPRAVRTRAIPGAAIRRGNGVDKGKNVTTKDTLAVILAVMEELRNGNIELRATVGELMNSNAALQAMGLRHLDFISIILRFHLAHRAVFARSVWLVVAAASTESLHPPRALRTSHASRQHTNRRPRAAQSYRAIAHCLYMPSAAVWPRESPAHIRS